MGDPRGGWCLGCGSYGLARHVDMSPISPALLQDQDDGSISAGEILGAQALPSLAGESTMGSPHGEANLRHLSHDVAMPKVSMCPHTAHSPTHVQRPVCKTFISALSEVAEKTGTT